MCVGVPSRLHTITPFYLKKNTQLVDWDFRHGMLRLYDEAALAAATTSESSSVPFDGLLDYWPLPGRKGQELQAARLVVGVGTEAVGPNKFVAVEVVVNGREVSDCMCAFMCKVASSCMNAEQDLPYPLFSLIRTRPSSAFSTRARRPACLTRRPPRRWGSRTRFVGHAKTKRMGGSLPSHQNDLLM